MRETKNTLCGYLQEGEVERQRNQDMPLFHCPCLLDYFSYHLRVFGKHACKCSEQICSCSEGRGFHNITLFLYSIAGGTCWKCLYSHLIKLCKYL